MFPRLATLGALLLSAVALAQAPAPAASADRVVYDAQFYAAFTPRTALDMIGQTPGFVLIAPEGNMGSERRGFSGAVGNVLIDGKRLGAKSQNLRDVLERVAATEVLRIEVLRGAEVAGDASGATVLANVVRTPASGGGTWEAGFEITNEEKPKPNGKFGWSGRNGDLEYSLGGTLFGHDHLSRGRFDVHDENDEIVAKKEFPIPHINDEYKLNGEIAFPLGEGRLSITGQAYLFKHRENTFQRTTTPDGEPIETELDPFREELRTQEAGVTWLRPVGDYELNLTALATRRQDETLAVATLLDAEEQFIEEFRQDARQDSGESIVRGTLARELQNGRLEFGAEAAINSLEGETALTLDEGAGPEPIDLPNANLRVEETRGEAFVSHVWRISERWSLDSRLAAETSRLSFTGDTDQSVSLSYVKPRVQLTRAFGRHQFQMRVYRDVGQLDFGDFVSSAELAEGNVTGGNPDLKPQTAWAVEAEADLRFGEDTAVRLLAYRHFVDDVADIVPFGPPGEQIDAPGNIGKGHVLGAELTVRLPLSAVLKGGTLNLTGAVSDTEVTDPVTGRRRKFSDTYENHLKIELRQDVAAARFAWGTVFEGYSHDTDYRLDETFSFRELPRLDLFAETTWIENFKIRLDVFSVLQGTEWRERRFYSPDRNGTLTGRETGDFYPGTWWQLTISSTF